MGLLTVTSSGTKPQPFKRSTCIESWANSNFDKQGPVQIDREKKWAMQTELLAIEIRAGMRSCIDIFSHCLGLENPGIPFLFSFFFEDFGQST
jgi:hypothetical protein